MAETWLLLLDQDLLIGVIEEIWRKELLIIMPFSSGIVKSSQVLVSGPHLENLTRWEQIGVAITDVNAQV